MKRSIAIVTGIGLAVSLLLAGALLPGRAPQRSKAPGNGDAGPLLLAWAVDTSRIDSTIASLQRRIEEETPTLAADQASLALAYLQKARSDAEPAVYDAAEQALAASFRAQPEGNFAATLGSAVLAGSRHDFWGQLEWARRAVESNPYNSQAIGIVGDAYLELGFTGKALDAYQKAVDLRPDASSFGRISYAAQLLGDSDSAVAAAERALEFARGSADMGAWAHWQLAELHIAAERLDHADAHLQRALALVPDFGLALESTAHLAAARGRTQRAIGILSSLVKDFPLPGNFAFLGELYLLQGQEARAKKAFEAADRGLARHVAHDVRPDVDFITFWVDRGIHLRRAVRVAGRLYSQRKSAAVSDSLAWALYRVGRFREAEHYAREAIRRSVGDAAYHYHAGMIAHALGKTAECRSLLRQALELDPSWSIIESYRARNIIAHGEPDGSVFPRRNGQA